MPYFVEFPTEFKSRDQFFAVVTRLATLWDRPFYWPPPPGPEILTEECDDSGMLSAKYSKDGITVEAKKGHYPYSFSKNRRVWGGGSEPKEEWVTFDQFPDLKPVKLNKRRGRPPELLLRAKIRGAKEDGLSRRQIREKFKIADDRSLRNFLKDGPPHAKKK